MSRPVFISYSRVASAPQAQALAARLGDQAFLDTDTIEDGEQFPQRLLDGILDASIVVIFATQEYAESRFCRLEMRLALTGGDVAASHLVLALGVGCDTVLDAMPVTVARQSWPDAEELERLAALVDQGLSNRLPAIRRRLSSDEARKLSTAFVEESNLPQPRSLHGVLSSLPPAVASQSIGGRFVGRADLLREIHRLLTTGSGTAAQLTSRLTAGGGFGKTRLAIEYVHRYARYYPGGIFWVNAEYNTLEGEFWRVLRSIDSNVPDLAVLRSQGRNVRRELEQALRQIRWPALYVIDGIPEAGLDEEGQPAHPQPIADFCPALGAIVVLATSRQDTREEGVRTLRVDALGRDSSILLLTDEVPGSASLSWAEWGQVAEWVGDLPIALDLLNRSLALGSISPQALLHRIQLADRASSATRELDRLSDALRGQVPQNALRGITETFLISFKKLDATAKQVAQLLAQLAPAPIPEVFMDALSEEWRSPAVRAALRGRHWLTGGSDLSFGVMHRLIADFLRSLAAEFAPGLLERACTALGQVMTPERCQDPRHWPVMRLCVPHAVTLFLRSSGMVVESHASSFVGTASWLLPRMRSQALAVVPASRQMGLAAVFLTFEQGDYAASRQLGEQVTETMRRVLGEEHPDTLTSMNGLAVTLLAQGDHAAARRLLERVVGVETRVLGGEHQDTLAAMGNLAEAFRAQGDYAEAQRIGERVLEIKKRVLGEEHPNTLAAMGSLAMTLGKQGDRVSARRFQERVLGVNTRLLGEKHPDTLKSMNNLAETLRELGDHTAARQLLERVVELETRALGEQHPDTLTTMGNLATTLYVLGDYAETRRLLDRVIGAMKSVLGEEHPKTLKTMGDLAWTRLALADNAGASRLAERVVKVRTRVEGEEHPHTLNSMSILVCTLTAQGDYLEAQRIGERVLEVITRVQGEEHPDTLRSMNRLATTFFAQGDQARAQQLQERALHVMTKSMGKEHPDTLHTMDSLAKTFFAQGDHTRARQLQECVLEARKRVLGGEHPDTLTAMNNLAATFYAQGDHTSARKLQEWVLEARKQLLGAEHPDTLAAMNNLAETLRPQDD